MSGDQAILVMNLPLIHVAHAPPDTLTPEVNKDRQGRAVRSPSSLKKERGKTSQPDFFFFLTVSLEISLDFPKENSPTIL